MLKDKAAAEDVVQNAFLKLYLNLDNIKNKSSVQFWIFKTARNEIYGIFRKEKTRNEIHYDSIDENAYAFSESQVAESFEKKELKQLVMKNLELLPQEQKEVFLLKEYGELSYREIADLLKIDKSLVKSRLYKTRQKLISQLAKVL